MIRARNAAFRALVTFWRCQNYRFGGIFGATVKPR